MKRTFFKLMMIAVLSACTSTTKEDDHSDYVVIELMTGPYSAPCMSSAPTMLAIESEDGNVAYSKITPLFTKIPYHEEAVSYRSDKIYTDGVVGRVYLVDEDFNPTHDVFGHIFGDDYSKIVVEKKSNITPKAGTISFRLSCRGFRFDQKY